MNTEAVVLDCAGAFDTFLNVQITLVLALQMALCLACSLVSLWWRNSAGYARSYLALNVYNEGACPRSTRQAAPVCSVGSPALCPDRCVCRLSYQSAFTCQPQQGRSGRTLWSQLPLGLI